jgi:hypothetical protein
MSAKGRGEKVVGKFGHVSTPAWTVDRLFEKWKPLNPGGVWLEPGAGTGAIIQAARHHVSPVWHAVERQARFKDQLYAAGADIVSIADYLKWSMPLTDVTTVLGNPDFEIAEETQRKFRELCPAAEIVLLLRVNFMASEERWEFFADKEPDLFVLPNRPSFMESGDTDATEYAWFRWGPYDEQEGWITMLNLTPKNIRRPG